MAKKTESLFGNKIKKLLTDRGAFVVKIHGGLYQASGLPDYYVASRIWTGWLELKVDGEPISSLQADKILKLNERGVPAFVLRLYSVEGIVQITDRQSRVFSTIVWKHVTGEEILLKLKELGCGC